ncbi:hypothetical protein [Lysinibacillus cavernae]|uniref:CDI toxin immunity protein n=1 Tax=Lysinibacillus cavernae TaxID=2666135 RepID=UPI003B75C206
MFGDKVVFEILDSHKSNYIVEDFCANFPIAFYNRIDWNHDSIYQININDQEINSIPSLLNTKGFDSLMPIYIFREYDSHPCVKTTLTKELVSTIEEIVWLGNDLYIYCPNSFMMIPLTLDGFRLTINFWQNRLPRFFSFIAFILYTKGLFFEILPSDYV